MVQLEYLQIVKATEDFETNKMASTQAVQQRKPVLAFGLVLARISQILEHDATAKTTYATFSSDALLRAMKMMLSYAAIDTLTHYIGLSGIYC